MATKPWVNLFCGKFYHQNKFGNIFGTLIKMDINDYNTVILVGVHMH